MGSVVTLFKSGGKMVGQIEELVSLYRESESRNVKLMNVIERQGAVLAVIQEDLTSIKQELCELKDITNESKRATDEIKRTKYYGQSPKLLDSAIEKVSKLTNKDIRTLIHRAANAHPKGIRKGYSHIYNKIFEVTGFSVYDKGQISLKKSDGIEGWKKDPSYINTILKGGVQKEAAVICKQILADR